MKKLYLKYKKHKSNKKIHPLKGNIKKIPVEKNKKTPLRGRDVRVGCPYIKKFIKKYVLLKKSILKK
jgi:hypothetical protein